MVHAQVINTLSRILKLTKRQKLCWKRPDEQWYEAEIDGRSISIRFLYVEATNQLGADPRFIEISMPSFHWVFAFGSEGATILLEILGEANVGHRSSRELLEGISQANLILDDLD